MLASMNPHVRFDLAHYPRRIRWVMGITWLLITVKCTLIWWAIGYWHVPFHPLWIVGPTLAFAILATSMWLTHREID